jgi:very-short-patch-repair endonuclease
MTKITRISTEARQHTRQLRRGTTETERRLWQHLRGRQMGGFKFRRQHPLGCYVLDFVCLEAGLVVEVDGGQHVDRADSDSARTRWLEQRGFQVLRFWNHEVWQHIEEVKAVIERALLLGSQPPSLPSPSQGGRGYVSAEHVEETRYANKLA